MNWLVIIGFFTLIALVLSGVVLLLLLRRRGVEALPDGDYLVTIIGTHETPRGVATVFRVDEPKEAEGQVVTIVKGKTG